MAKNLLFPVYKNVQKHTHEKREKKRRKCGNYPLLLGCFHFSCRFFFRRRSSYCAIPKVIHRMIKGEEDKRQKILAQEIKCVLK